MTLLLRPHGSGDPHRRRRDGRSHRLLTGLAHTLARVGLAAPGTDADPDDSIDASAIEPAPAPAAPATGRRGGRGSQAGHGSQDGGPGGLRLAWVGRAGRHLDPGTVLDTLAARGSATLVRLDRPLDLAPDGGLTWTIPQLASLVRQWAARLDAAGVRPGDRVAVVKRNHWDYTLLACAAARIGAVPALLSDQLSPETLALLLTRLNPAVLVTEGVLLRTAAEHGVRLSLHARRTVCLDTARDGLPPDVLLGSQLPCYTEPGSRTEEPFQRHEDQPLAIFHTSGTTGVPKLVVHTTRSLVRRLSGFEARRWPLVTARSGDTVASAISFAHGRGLSWTISALWRQPGQLLLISDPDPDSAGPVLRAHPPTIIEALPSVYARWRRLAEPQRPAQPGDGDTDAHSVPVPRTGGGRVRRGSTAVSALAQGGAAGAAEANPFRDVRLYISTFDAMHPPVVRAFLNASQRRAPLWMQGWGQSETGPLTFRFLTRRALAARAERHPTTRDLGRPVPGWVSLQVVDPVTLAPVPRGVEGLVLARTPGRCRGYVGEDERLEHKLLGTWFNTGDMGVHTRRGSLLLLDREVDMVPGLSCVELEDVLHDRLPEVEEAVVLGVPGSPPLPVLVTATGALDPDRWADAVRDLPPLATPRLVGPYALPRTATGKVRRHELRERYLHAASGYGSGRWT